MENKYLHTHTPHPKKNLGGTCIREEKNSIKRSLFRHMELWSRCIHFLEIDSAFYNFRI